MGFFIVLGYVPLLLMAVFIAIKVSEYLGRYSQPGTLSAFVALMALVLGVLIGCIATRYVAMNVWPGPIQDFTDLFKAMGVSLVFPFLLCGAAVFLGDACVRLSGKDVAKEFFGNIGSGAVHATWALPLVMYIMA